MAKWLAVGLRGSRIDLLSESFVPESPSMGLVNAKRNVLPMCLETLRDQVKRRIPGTYGKVTPTASRVKGAKTQEQTKSQPDRARVPDLSHR